MAVDVDLVTNVYERSYRRILQPGVFADIQAQNRVRFARRTALINNVADRADAEAHARALIEAGELDHFAFVDDLLPQALEVTGTRAQDLGRIAHFNDYLFVAVTMEGPPWLVYWDADIHMAEPHDWITPAQELMAADPRILVANPRWRDPTLERETLAREGDFALGLGFSDQLFLVRRRDLAAPIYHQWCVARLKHPLAEIGTLFEARVHAWMRHHGLLRATYLPALYIHPPETAGLSYPDATFADRLRWYRNRLLFEAARHSPIKRYCWRYL